MSRFLIWLSGAHKPTLAKCPSERNKFLGIGGAVLTTAVMATAACTLTLRMAVGVPLSAAMAVGLVWGLAILNLDRWLVASTTRQDSVSKTIAVFLPRLALALIIGMVISEPLVLRVFQPEINSELEVMQLEQKATNARALEEDPDYARIPAMEEEIEQLERIVSGQTDSAAVLEDAEVAALTADVEAKQDEFNLADQAVICEKEGTCGSGKVGAGPAYEEKVARRDALRAELDALTTQLEARKEEVRQNLAEVGGEQQAQAQLRLDGLRAEVMTLTAEREAAREELQEANTDSAGLLARMEALDRLAEESGTLNAARWILRLFIIAIDTLPVLVKMLMAFGKPSLYDIELAKAEEQAGRLNDDDRHDAYELVRLEASVAVDQARLRHKMEVASQEALAQKIVDAQTELAERIIDAWKARQEDDIAKNIDSYIEEEVRLP